MLWGGSADFGIFLTSSVLLLLVVRPGAPRSVLAPFVPMPGFQVVMPGTKTYNVLDFDWRNTAIFDKHSGVWGQISHNSKCRAC